ncbi:MAG: hypothetical protein L6V91_05615 [Bacilli bacterium]|nr:MAG: hypothetical protein L6V91_05615 [Bacilli bacterium]
MNSDKLNNIIKEKSKGNNNLAHHLHQMFFFEHVFDETRTKVSIRTILFLKGGVLLSSIIGEDLRTTKDLDATLKGMPLNIDSIRNIFLKKYYLLQLMIIFVFEIVSIKDIRLEDEYGGFRINVKGLFL